MTLITTGVKRMKKTVSTAVALFLIVLTPDLWAASSQTIGGVASTITQSFEQLARLITAGSYLAGLGFAVGSIMKFKQHKDNPTQIPIGTPIALLFIAAALLFLPTILGVAGATLFGSDATTAGPTGTVFSGS